MCDIPKCIFNEITDLATPSASDCDNCQSMFSMPHGYCCLEECGEHEFCVGCEHGIYEDEYNLQIKGVSWNVTK